MKVGIFFGGSSREREVSFAGGRTVYDNLDKRLFEAVPLFVDEFGNMVELNWEYVYRGTIRDFYPPVEHLPESPNAFQIYSESIKLSHADRLDMISKIGAPVQPDQLKELIDFAFLAMHGEHGEDGTIQGLLEWYGIPYSGSGILPSAVGMNKAIQKKWMENAGFEGPAFITIGYDQWKSNPAAVYDEAMAQVNFPLVVKSANQGSSIGVTVMPTGDFESFAQAVDNSFFIKTLTLEHWESCNQVEYVRELSDIRSSLGFPLFVNEDIVHHPEEALVKIQEALDHSASLRFQAIRGDVEVVIEQFISGREFSCIVVKKDNGEALALPPTEIAKSTQFFDYKSKYLPGLSRKITPIDLPNAEIERIRKQCCELFDVFGFNVYARIDGFYTEAGQILLNDPNTTSGMMPSSFFFHQAAEIGLNPSQFLTYIIRTSLADRIASVPLFVTKRGLLDSLDTSIEQLGQRESNLKRVGVIMGGYSTERHISVESGRNIYEKLASSGKYLPVPVFLTGSNEEHRLFHMPINIMLKDNADDIKSKLENFYQPDILNSIIEEAKDITTTYAGTEAIFQPQEISYEGLRDLCDLVFIALHGRPGEDGAVQRKLNTLGIPYNGSGVDSSSMTIDKYKTNNLLRENGFLVADGVLIKKEDWRADKAAVMDSLTSMNMPYIAKPSDEGCSSAVEKLDSIEDLETYAEITFRDEAEIQPELRQKLDVGPKEEFPQKDYFLVENFIQRGGAKHFLEITGGLLTKYVDGQLVYEIFEPSEALAEGEILSLAEKFLAGEGQNITPARFSTDTATNSAVSTKVRSVLEDVAKCLKVEGYCRIDAFVRIFENGDVDVVIIEINSLPGMTPATCIYHQAAINGYKPFDFIDEILTF
ncbi:MAG: D-alanine--D-alanine ligase, partial [Bacteroidia bacterium]|nr:D-alanine--D-alanine ligase [Bacteroidia bacterium]